jgi:hypothetical protein
MARNQIDSFDHGEVLNKMQITIVFLCVGWKVVSIKKQSLDDLLNKFSFLLLT